MNSIIFNTKNIKYSIPIENIKEMIHLVEINTIDEYSFVDGSINYHSNQIPLIEASKLFNINHGIYNSDSIIIILNISDTLFSLLTDSIDSFVDKDLNIEINNTFDYPFSNKSFIYNEKNIYLLDLNKVLLNISSDITWRNL